MALQLPLAPALAAVPVTLSAWHDVINPVAVASKLVYVITPVVSFHLAVRLRRTQP
ncbi:hypothetical protein MJ579_23685 [Klebsiella pneumoniae]|nr:hypothetical protein MJ579_23685 [Klebsiella pneumoniae]